MQRFLTYSSRGDTKALKKLRRKYPDLDINSIVDEDGWNALHWAAHNGSINLCLWLLQNGADPTSMDWNLNTPMDRLQTRFESYDSMVALALSRMEALITSLTLVFPADLTNLTICYLFSPLTLKLREKRTSTSPMSWLFFSHVWIRCSNISFRKDNSEEIWHLRFGDSSLRTSQWDCWFGIYKLGYWETTQYGLMLITLIIFIILCLLSAKITLFVFSCFDGLSNISSLVRCQWEKEHSNDVATGFFVLTRPSSFIKAIFCLTNSRLEVQTDLI